MARGRTGRDEPRRPGAPATRRRCGRCGGELAISSSAPSGVRCLSCGSSALGGRSALQPQPQAAPIAKLHSWRRAPAVPASRRRVWPGTWALRLPTLPRVRPPSVATRAFARRGVRAAITAVRGSTEDGGWVPVAIVCAAGLIGALLAVLSSR